MHSHAYRKSLDVCVNKVELLNKYLRYSLTKNDILIIIDMERTYVFCSIRNSSNTTAYIVKESRTLFKKLWRVFLLLESG